MRSSARRIGLATVVVVAAFAPVTAATAGDTCPAPYLQTADRFVGLLDARSYRSAHALLDNAARSALPLPAFEKRFDARRDSLGGGSLTYVLKGEPTLARQYDRRRRLAVLIGSTCRVEYETHFPKMSVTERVTVTRQPARRGYAVSDFDDRPLKR